MTISFETWKRSARCDVWEYGIPEGCTENERLLLNKSILGLGTYRLFLELV